jgi:multidrug resistance efflux pump
MTIKLTQLSRAAITAIVVLIAIFVAYKLWVHYKVEPWTRDGRVQANVVQVAPDVSGLVTNVLVHDNQVVNAGDVLFIIDPARYQLALAQAKAQQSNAQAVQRQAEAAESSAQTQLAQAGREVARNRALRDLVSGEQNEQSVAKRDQLQATIAQAQASISQAQAAIAQAQAAVDSATLNLQRTTIRATVKGRVTNLELRLGDYAAAGKPLLALIDLQSIYVIGYFEETKIDHIHAGDSANVRLMGDHQTLRGHVESISGGITDRELGASANLLANVNPTFNWVRLAQRIPVRIHLDQVPAETQLIMGRTATVEVIHSDSDAKKSQGAS